MLDRVDHIFANRGDIGAKIFNELFHIFTLRVLIGGAGIEDDGEIVTTRNASDILFVRVQKRADHRGFGAAQIGRRREGGKPAFVTEREQKSFENVVRMMTERHFVRSFAMGDRAECAAAQFRAKTARVRFLAHGKKDLGDVGFFLEERNALFLEIGA